MGDGEEDCKALVMDETRCKKREKTVVGRVCRQERLGAARYVVF